MKINQITRRVLTRLILTCMFVFMPHLGKTANLDFATNTSTIQVNSGANFIVETTISNVAGTIIQDDGATIDGQEISFVDGKYQSAKNKIGISGSIFPGTNGKVILDGNKTFRGKRGTSFKKIEIRGKNNRIEGDITIEDDITLLDANASVSADIITNLKSNIILNGGSLYIREDDLQFVDTKRVFGPGKIYVNGNKLIFGAKPITLSEPLYFIDAEDLQFNDNVTLEAPITFSGEAIIEGHFNLFSMSETGKIIVERGSSLLLKNMILYNVGNGNIFCMDNLGTITLQNTKIYLASDYTFSIGKLAFSDKVSIFGNSKFVYNSPMQSLILSKGTLTLDEGMTFSYDPGNMRKDLIAFQDDLSCLKLDGATLHATLTGMQLTKGCLLVKHNSFISSEKTNLIDEGITLGNDNVDDDFCCEILKSSKLEIRSGSLKYRNIATNAWYMENNMSTLELNANCNLYLYQNLNIDPGVLNYKGRGGFFYAAGKTLNGSLNVNGYLDYLALD